MLVRDAEDLSTMEYLTVLISYLEVLSNGRAKPSRNEGYVRESLDNIKEINLVKEKINDVLRIVVKPDQISVTFK